MSSMVNCSEREVASVSFKVDFDKFRVLGHTKCSRREEKMQEKNAISLEMDVRREVKRVA
jgi:hypothetical protein